MVMKNKRIVIKVMVGISLLAFGVSHGITGLLANIGWYDVIGVDFDAWYMHPAYQSMCWFANGIALSILVPMLVTAVRVKMLVTAVRVKSSTP